MNFILSIIMLFILFVISIYTGQQFETQSSGFGFLAYIVAFFTGFGSLGMFIIGFFQTMGLRSRYYSYLNDITRYQEDIIIQEDALKTYIDYAKKDLIKLYPDYEKTIFSKLAPDNVGELKKYLADYPELNFSSVLQGYISDINIRLNEITYLKLNISKRKNNIADLKTSGWYLLKIKG